MEPAPAGSLLEHLQQIPDPRGRQGLRHVLTAMLATIVLRLVARGAWLLGVCRVDSCSRRRVVA